jgi:hypothetical protein
MKLNPAPRGIFISASSARLIQITPITVNSHHNESSSSFEGSTTKRVAQEAERLDHQTSKSSFLPAGFSDRVQTNQLTLTTSTRSHLLEANHSAASEKLEHNQILPVMVITSLF